MDFKELVSRDISREQLEDWCRKQTQMMPAGPDLVLCRVLGKYLMYVLQKDSSIAPHLACSGIWEPWITMAIARHLQPGMHCLNVGACYGYYSILMRDIVGPDGGVDAFEAEHRSLLSTNCEINGLRDRTSRRYSYRQS